MYSYLVIGMGINVTGSDLPQALHDERDVVSLAQLGIETTARELEEPLLAQLHSRLAQATGQQRDDMTCIRYHKLSTDHR